MIRQERDAVLKHVGHRMYQVALVGAEREGFIAGYKDVVDYASKVGPRARRKKNSRAEYGGHIPQSSHRFNSRFRGRHFWVYRGEVYSTLEELAADEVEALVDEQVNKKRVKIARAKTIAAMADQLDRKGARQAIPQDLKIAVWQRDQGKCRRCGSTTELQFDHDIPHSHGGATSLANLQVLCGACNREKGASL